MKKDTKQQHNTHQTKTSQNNHHNQADGHNKADSNIKHKPTQRPQYKHRHEEGPETAIQTHTTTTSQQKPPPHTKTRKN